MSILPGPKLNKKTIVFLLVFTGFLIFWILINVFHTFSNLNSARSVFTNTYGVIAFIGGIFAIYISKLWGGYKSLIGRAIFIFGLSLLAQEFGQLMYAYYIYVRHIPVPYPSLGDIGYFGSDLLILFAIYTLFRASGSKFSLTTLTNKLQTIIIPIIILSISYTIFLRGYVFSGAHPLTVFLDFGYPFVEAIYVSIAVLVLTLSRKYLGGLMKMPIVFVLLSLMTLYIADFIFLYQVKNNTWVPGGSNDLEYCIAYFLLSLSLLSFERAYSKIKSADSQTKPTNIPTTNQSGSIEEAN